MEKNKMEQLEKVRIPGMQCPSCQGKSLFQE